MRAKEAPSSSRQGTRKASLEVEQADPFGRNRDPYHVRDHSAKFFDPGLALFAPEVALGSKGVFGDDSVHGLQARTTTDQKHFVGKHVVVDSE